jgi:hypothetical protein
VKAPTKGGLGACPPNKQPRQDRQARRDRQDRVLVQGLEDRQDRRDSQDRGWCRACGGRLRSSEKENPSESLWAGQKCDKMCDKCVIKL